MRGVYSSKSLIAGFEFGFGSRITCQTAISCPKKKKGGILAANQIMSALFNFHSFLTVVLLVICTCTYIKIQFPAILEHRTGFRGFFWKAARIGERLSPWVAVGCFAMGVSILVF